MARAQGAGLKRQITHDVARALRTCTKEQRTYLGGGVVGLTTAQVVAQVLPGGPSSERMRKMVEDTLKRMWLDSELRRHTSEAGVPLWVHPEHY